MDESWIRDWKEQMSAAGAFEDDQLEELASHLADERDHLLRLGLSEHEARMIAERRLGAPSTVADEFAKVTPPHRQQRTLLAIAYGAFAILVAASLQTLTIALAVSLGIRLGAPLDWFAPIVSLANLMAPLIAFVAAARAISNRRPYAALLVGVAIVGGALLLNMPIDPAARRELGASTMDTISRAWQVTSIVTTLVTLVATVFVILKNTEVRDA